MKILQIHKSAKRLKAPSLLVILSAICLSAVGLLGRSIWEGLSIWTILPVLLSLGLLFIPSTEMGRELLSGFTRPAIPMLLSLLLMVGDAESKVVTSGLSLILYGLSLSFLVFNGKGRGISNLCLGYLWTMLFSYLVYTRYRSGFAVLCIGLTCLAVLFTASATGWFGKEWRALHMGTVLALPAVVLLPLNSYDSSSFFTYLSNLVDPYVRVSYMDEFVADSLQAHLSRMLFVGKTCSGEGGMEEPYYFEQHRSRILAILGHEVGWFVYPAVGLLIALLIVGLVLLAIRRKGLGRLVCLAAIGTVAAPLVLLFLTNLGVFEAWPTHVPLLGGSLTTNLASLVLLRLAVAFRSDPACFLSPPAEDDVPDLELTSDDEEDLSEDRSLDGIGHMTVIPVPADDYIQTICKIFGGQVEIPFRGNMEEALKGKNLLYTQFHGDLADILSIFSQLKFAASERHFVKISLSEESNISRVLFGVERVTHALTDENNVDYCVGIDEDIPKNIFWIRIVSTKAADASEAV